ncbi:MAG TPA: YtxH domain-containing protein [Candidatus Limnocylindria bacterium]|nr:YtxH domain-containing protein [Candidatus Limnocylindria bacterium]
MFGVINAALRAFVVGVVVGTLIAPRPGAETRRLLNERISALINQLLEIAALPPIEPSQAATNGHTERPAPKRSRSAEGSSARTTT